MRKAITALARPTVRRPHQQESHPQHLSAESPLLPCSLPHREIVPYACSPPTALTAAALINPLAPASPVDASAPARLASPRLTSHAHARTHSLSRGVLPEQCGLDRASDDPIAAAHGRPRRARVEGQWRAPSRVSPRPRSPPPPAASTDEQESAFRSPPPSDVVCLSAAVSVSVQGCCAALCGRGLGVVGRVPVRSRCCLFLAIRRHSHRATAPGRSALPFVFLPRPLVCMYVCNT